MSAVMQYLNYKEGLFPALFFFLAIIILVLGPLGPLTMPGILAGLAGVIFAAKKLLPISALIGVIGASISLIGQALTAICPYCTVAATMFAIGGLLSLALIVGNKPVWMTLLLPLIASIVFFAANTIPHDMRSFNIAVQNSSGQINQSNMDIPLLFISPGCKSCKEAVQEYVRLDPDGKYWMPVIVPNMGLNKGTDGLRKLGYTGQVYSASTSPSAIVPCLKNGDQIFSGSGNVIAQTKKFIKVY